VPKLGRNDPCPCGSTLKYKKCCDPTKLERRQYTKGAVHASLAFDEAEFAKQGGYCRPHIHTMHGGERVRAVGSAVHRRPPQETFHEFLINFGKWSFGERWYKDQLKLPRDQMHQFMLWCVAYSDFSKANATEANQTATGWSAVPSGPVSSLLLMGNDLYWLQHTGNWSGKLMKRLRDRHEFQGARYELAIASMFARFGYKLRFLNEKSTRHCEFIATHASGSPQIAVEVKSRRRPGVYHHPGKLDEETAVRGDVWKLLDDAMKQDPGNMPFLIFVDVNALPTPGTHLFAKTWATDVKGHLERLGAPSPENPDSFTGLVFTNYAYHYGDNAQPAPPSEHIAIWSNYPRHQLKEDVVGQLMAALDRYGETPEENQRPAQHRPPVQTSSSG
jgi:hypothetical protein